MYFISTACVFNFKHLRFSYLFFNFFLLDCNPHCEEHNIHCMCS